MAQRPRPDPSAIAAILALAALLWSEPAAAASASDAAAPGETAVATAQDAAAEARLHGRSLAMTSGYYLTCGNNGLIETEGDILRALGVMSVLYLDLVDEEPDAWTLQGAKGYLLRRAAAGGEAKYVPITARSCLEIARKAEGYVGLLRDKLFPAKP
ncbi:MAG TPA: hypothetical protein VLL72_07475 [Kiloniellales bacterium]|nr:hypothetical protein [Kiloniellales bacterium]